MAPLPPPRPGTRVPPAYHPGAVGPPPFPPRFAPAYGYGAKKSNTGVVVTLSIIGVFVVVGGLIAAFAFAGGSPHRVADAGYESHPTITTSEASTPTTSASPTPTSTRSTTRTSRASSTAPTTQKTPSGPKPVRALKDNPLFATSDNGLPNRPCQLARWSNNPDAAAKFFDSAKACLDTVWQVAMNDANLPFRAPAVKYPSGSNWSSPCGGSAKADNVAAFYCSQNETLYLPYEGLQVNQYGAHPGVYLAVFAHEYGHHAQTLSGVTDAFWDARYEAGTDSAAGLELSRRHELEAQCFSGMFLGSTENRGGDVDTNIYNEAWQSQDRGDVQGGKRDHGTMAHAVSWWQYGATTNRLTQCDTWSASSGDVS
jgi:predicted metalloprotease